SAPKPPPRTKKPGPRPAPRGAVSPTAIPAAIARVREAGHAVELIFRDSSDDALVRRYRETRRVHPLSPDGSVEHGIEVERLLLRDVAALADRAIDTSQLNVHQLKTAIVQGV